MAERKCKYPDCNTMLSRFVPSEVTLCGYHQLSLREAQAKLGSENLPESDVLFIASHLDGCTGRQLFRQLGGSRTSYYIYLRSGKIKAEKSGKNPHNWVIPAQEIIWVLVLVRNWITVYKAARSIKAGTSEFRNCAKRRRFGKTRRHLSGALAIRKDSNFGQIYAELKVKSHTGRNWRIKKGLLDGETSCGIIADELGLSVLTVRSWRRNGWFESKRTEGQVVVIEEEVFVDFATKAVAGDGSISIDAESMSALSSFLSEGGFSNHGPS